MFRKQKKQQLTFDENSIDITLQHGLDQLQEFKVIYKWRQNRFEGRFPTLTCQWFNKSLHSMEIIQGIIEETYQPSIIDVNTTIYVQMMPVSSQMEYIGMPITKFFGPLKLSAQTEQQVKDMLQAGKSTYFVEIKSIKLNNQEKSKGQLAKVKEALLKVVKNRVMLYIKFDHSQKSELLREVEVGKHYPKLTMDRRNSKLMTFDFGQGEYVELHLQNHRIRDVLYLLVQKIREKVDQYTISVELNEIKHSQKITLIQMQPKQQQKTRKQKVIAEELTPELKIEVISQKNNQQKTLKPEETLPKSPQTTQPHRQQKQEEQKISKLQDITREAQKKIKELTETNERLSNALRSLSAEKQQFEEEAYYFRNQCQIQKLLIAELNTQVESLSKLVKQKQLETQLKMAQIQASQLYGNYLQLNRQQILDCIVQLTAEIKTERRKTEYQIQRADLLDSEIKQLNNQVEEKQLIIKKMEKKIESIIDKNVIGEFQPQQHTFSHQLGSYEFEISKLKEQLNLVTASKHDALGEKDKIIDSLRSQVRELIEENSYYRAKDKSSKGELKNEIVELKKLVNRFAESITEKDIQITQLRMTNREISKQLHSGEKS